MRKEYQIKFTGMVDVSLLISLGAEVLGQTTQKDVYLASDSKTWRLREEAGEYVFAQKGHDRGRRARVKDVDERPVKKAEADLLVKAHGVRAVVCKTRTLYRLNQAVVTLDEVEHLGDFVEIRSTCEGELFRTLDLLGIDRAEAIRESYLDMMISQKLPKWLQSVLRLHEKVGELTFGITSGILTTVGVLTGVNSATSSKLSVVAAIVAIAVADSCSDAFGMYLSKVAERGSNRADALRHALGTLAGKFFFPLTFILPIFVCPLSVGVILDLVWGGSVLALLSIEQAVVAQESPIRHVLVNVGLAAFIVCLSTFTGMLVAHLG